MKILFCFLLSLAVHAYTAGSGSNFSVRFTDDPAPVRLSIYIADFNGSDELAVEYFFSTTNSIIPLEMWQQFQFRISDNGVKPVKGFVQLHKAGKPETLPASHLDVNKGVKLGDFLFAKKSDLQKNMVAEEQIQTPAGKVKAIHYQMQRSGQTVDFWIADEAKPIGLVRLISKGKSRDQRYKIELNSLMKNVKATIDPKKAVPLTPETKKFLPRPL